MEKSLIGRKFGNLTVLSLNHVDKTTYRYPAYMYDCFCELCEDTVLIPGQNVRNYVDCGRHRVEKISKFVEYKDSLISLNELSRLAKISHSYVRRLLAQGHSAEDIIQKRYSTAFQKKKNDNARMLKQLGISRAAVSWRLKNGWVLKEVDGKYSMEKRPIKT